MSTHKPRLILHVGMPKTGSTSIQMFLDQHKNNNKYCYPESGRYAGTYCHHQFAMSLASSREHIKTPLASPKDFHELTKSIKSEFSTSEKSILILSSELFWNLKAFNIHDLKKLKSAFSEFDITVVMIIRNKKHHAYSSYAQRVCGIQRYTGTFTKHIEYCISGGMWDYEHKYAQFLKAFDNGNIQCIDFDSSKQIVESFFDASRLTRPDGVVQNLNRRKSWCYVYLTRMKNIYINEDLNSTNIIWRVLRRQYRNSAKLYFLDFLFKPIWPREIF